jgi:toxin ParE1/3/4
VRRLRFHPDARDEYRSATEDYAAVSSVAPAFVAAVERGLRLARALPGVAGPVPSSKLDLRRYVLRRFPYVLVYLVEPGEIVVLAVAHTHRRPGYWRRRLRG